MFIIFFTKKVGFAISLLIINTQIIKWFIIYNLLQLLIIIIYLHPYFTSHIMYVYKWSPISINLFRYQYII